MSFKFAMGLKCNGLQRLSTPSLNKSQMPWDDPFEKSNDFVGFSLRQTIVNQTHTDRHTQTDVSAGTSGESAGVVLPGHSAAAEGARARASA